MLLTNITFPWRDRNRSPQPSRLATGELRVLAGPARHEFRGSLPSGRPAEIGVGMSTLRRWVKDFGERGPAGLADDRRRRRMKPLAGADPRWLKTARQVLADRTDASRPTQDLVLAEIAARLEAEHGTAAVPVPSPTRARLPLREISRGTSAFGGTKAKREIAGRLTPACRPG
jgi:Helix-turn-helix domain